MSNYKAIVSYYFKKGEEEKGLKLLEQELKKFAKALKCEELELLRYEKDPSLVIGIGLWNSLEEARLFQREWQSVEEELAPLCTRPIHHQFFKCHAAYTERGKKAA